MVTSATLSRADRGTLLMNNIDIEHTDWLEQYGNDFVIVHNPTFKFQARHPYKLGDVLAVICNDGEATGTINLRQYHLRKNNLVIVLADHIMESFEVSPDFKSTYIFMSQSFLYGLNIGDGYKFYESVENNPCILLDDRTANAVNSYVNMCRAMIEISDLNPNTKESLQLLTRLFFLNMGWFIHREAVKKTTDSRQSEVMNAFISLVKSNYHEHRDVEYYAGRMNLTAKYLTTLIKKASGKPALQWIEDYVILDAKAQLSSTQNSIQQICYDLNFPTPSFFGRYFKRAVGMSPSEYRKSIRMNTDTV